MGALAAIVLSAVLSDLGSLEAISQALSGLPPELRMAVDLGIIDPSDFYRGGLNVPIKKRDFALLVKNTLQLLGDPKGAKSFLNGPMFHRVKGL